MTIDEQDPFDEYVPEAQTANTLPVSETSEPFEIVSAKYGINKPRRIIVRGTVAADRCSDDKRG
jgi:hypothetical protein